MTSFFAAIWMTIRSIPPYTRNTLLHVLLSLILLFLTAHTINVCNQVPYTKANLTLVTSTGQNDIDLDITVDIGANTIPGNVPDSMFIDKLGANGRTGFRITVLVPSNGEHNTVNWRNAGYGDGLLQYVDVTLDGDDNITAIGLTASYENIENAKRQYEQIVSTFEQKYGKGNVHPEGQLTFWTDDVNSVGVYYQESASIDGSDRSFCSLYYTNIALSDKLDAQNMSDI